MQRLQNQNDMLENNLASGWAELEAIHLHTHELDQTLRQALIEFGGFGFDLSREPDEVTTCQTQPSFHLLGFDPASPSNHHLIMRA